MNEVYSEKWALKVWIPYATAGGPLLHTFLWGAAQEVRELDNNGVREAAKVWDTKEEAETFAIVRKLQDPWMAPFKIEAVRVHVLGPPFLFPEEATD